MRTLILLGSIILFFGCVPPERDADEVFKSIEEKYKLQLGVAGINITTGETLYFKADTLFGTASVIKTPILIELYRQYDLALLAKNKVVVLDSSRVYPGSGVLQYTRVPFGLSLQDAATLMIILSDNTATNLVFDELGSDHEARLHAVNSTMRSLGLEHTEMLNKPFGYDTRKDTPYARRYGIGVSSPEELARMMALLAKGVVVSPEASREIIEIHKKQQWTEMAPRYIPVAEDTLMFAHKTGMVNRTRCDIGLIISPVDTIAYAVMTDLIEEVSWMLDSPGNLGVAEAALEMYGRLGKMAAGRVGSDK
jgi:beta-lactamase class A